MSSDSRTAAPAPVEGKTQPTAIDVATTVRPFVFDRGPAEVTAASRPATSRPTPAGPPARVSAPRPAPMKPPARVASGTGSGTSAPTRGASYRSGGDDGMGWASSNTLLTGSAWGWEGGLGADTSSPCAPSHHGHHTSSYGCGGGSSNYSSESSSSYSSESSSCGF